MVRDDPSIGRRTVLKGIGMAGVSLTFAGYAGAAERAKYIVTGRGTGVRSRVRDAGFEVTSTFAGGSVFVAAGDPDRRESLEDVDGVEAAVRNFRLEFEEPVDFEEVETDRETDDETDREEAFFDSQWDKRITDVTEAHETATGAGSTIAVIDTGTDVDGHPDLPNVDADGARLFRDGAVREGEGPIEFPATVTDLGDGTTTRESHVADDVYYHGTHVAGVAAASTGAGVLGTAPDADVVPLRVFWWLETEDGAATLGTTTEDILAAIDYAAELGVDAANMSIGTPPLPPRVNATGFQVAYERVIQHATKEGTVVVASAGNSGANLQQGGYFTVPNSTAGAMSISATGPTDLLTYYSNYGTNEIDVGAPGGGYETAEKTFDPDADVELPRPTNWILSSADPESWIGLLLGGTEYVWSLGTSFAAPQVTGAAALVREVNPDATPAQVEDAIKRGADLVEGRDDPELGAGRLNAADAVDEA